MKDDVINLESDLIAPPEFESTGAMPPGIHDCSLQDLAELTSFNEHRKRMWRQFISFLSVPMYSHHFVHAYVGGDFLSTKENPSTIDVLLETSDAYGPESLAAVCPYFLGGIDRVETLFGINLHFRMEGAPDAEFDGPFATPLDEKSDNPTTGFKAGIARLNLTAADSLLNLREIIREN